MSKVETTAIEELQDDINTYLIKKASLSINQPESVFLNIQDYFSMIRVSHMEKSNVYYLKVMDAIADSKDTLMSLLHELHQQYIVEQNREWLLVEGDAKVYVLESIKNEYGDAMSWLYPYPGVWHLLKNYQCALMKPYFDAGLKTLAHKTGYPATAIQSCGQFKRTHHFILEVWEAINRAMLQCFMQKSITASGEDMMAMVLHRLHCVLYSTGSFHSAYSRGISDIQDITNTFFDNFKRFLDKMASVDDTWRFWIQFTFKDAFAYVGLFLAIRSGDWNLRLASIKLMAPLFTAFDHVTYKKLISVHIADVLAMPRAIVTMFNQGAFVVSISGRAMHSVGIDEAHEMLINRECKSSLVRPSQDYINRIAHYIPY